MTPTDLRHSTPFRLAALFAVMFVILALAVFVVAYWQTGAELKFRVKNAIMEIADTLIATYREKGLANLQQRITDHAETAAVGESIYLLTDLNGTKIAGNIAAMAPFAGWREIPSRSVIFSHPSKGDPDAFISFGIILDDGFLLIGRGNYAIEEVQEVLTTTLGWGLGFTVLAALAGGLILGRQTQRRIGGIVHGLNAIAVGDLESPIPLHGNNDDLDQVARQINRAADRIAGLIESIRQVSTDIAHDLRTPISRLQQRLELAHGETASSAQYGDTVAGALQDVREITAIFEALLRIAQLEGGERRAGFKEIRLADVLANVADAYEAVAEDAGYGFVRAFDKTGAARVHGDTGLLTQLFSNLVENVFRHCPAGTVITVGLEGDANGVSAYVSDTGPGIPEDEQEKVMRRFYRLEKSRTTQGSGLGLSLVAAIADLHDAEFRLENCNPGLKCSLHLPAIDQADRPSEDQPSRCSSGRQRPSGFCTKPSRRGSVPMTVVFSCSALDEEGARKPPRKRRRANVASSLFPLPKRVNPKCVV